MVVGWHLPSYQNPTLQLLSVFFVHILHTSVVAAEDVAVLVYGEVVVFGVSHGFFNGLLQVFTLNKGFDKFLRIKGELWYQVGGVMEAKRSIKL